MKFISIAALAICVAASQALASIVIFNQELAGDVACNHAQAPEIQFKSYTKNEVCGGPKGTLQPACTTYPCKHNFNNGVVCILFTKPHAGCHISLYELPNEGGKHVLLVDTGKAGPYHTAGPAKSSGIYCP